MGIQPVLTYSTVVQMSAGCILWAQSVSVGYGLPLGGSAVLQSMPVSYVFGGCKTLLSIIVSGAISSELPFTFFTFDRVRSLLHCGLNK